MIPHLCPRCGGETRLPVAYAGTLVTASRPCPTCRGVGVLWEPDGTEGLPGDQVGTTSEGSADALRSPAVAMPQGVMTIEQMRQWISDHIQLPGVAERLWDDLRTMRDEDDDATREALDDGTGEGTGG